MIPDVWGASLRLPGLAFAAWGAERALRRQVQTDMRKRARKMVESPHYPHVCGRKLEVVHPKNNVYKCVGCSPNRIGFALSVREAGMFDNDKKFRRHAANVD
jgi:hypothetical protein